MSRLTHGVVIALLLTLSGILGVASAHLAPTEDCCPSDEQGVPESCPLPCATCPGLAFVTPPPRDIAMPTTDTRLIAPPPDHRHERLPEPPRPGIFHPPRISA